ncbi:hypothetical protein TPDSL_18070 [Terrisporobacter petrolearius]|uniref:hypothetical protein n=1 Tax=Terrisporobacter petrolearius TaxID=1460447 RepID=UPI0033662905
MLTDVDKEFDTPEIDEDGELIETIEIEEAFEDVDNAEPTEQENYDGEDDDIALESEDEEFDDIQEVTVEAKENFENAKDRLVEIFTSILENGEITEEDNTEIEQLKEQYTQAYNDIKENTEVIQKKTLEERVQELSDGMIGASTDEILAILTDNGRKPWLYKDDDGNVLMDGTAIPELTILLNKLSLIATDGENEGEIQLSPGFINLIATSTIVLSAKNINLDGYVNEGGNWSVDTLGNMNVKNLDVEGHLSTNELSISSIKCSTLPSMVLQDTVIKVTTTAIDDSAIFQDNAEYNTLQGAIDSIPTILNGSLVTIQLEKDIREDILIRGISGGSLYINLSSNVTIYGNVMVRDNSGRIAFYGTKDANGNAISNIIPNSMINIVNRECSVVVQTSQFVMFSNINIYGKVDATNNDYYYALLSLDGSNAYFGGGKITGSDNAFRTNSLGRIYISDSYGKVNNYVFRAVSGGIIHVGNDTQCNSSSSTKFLADTACIIQISSSFNKWDTTSTTGNNTNTTTSTKSVTYKSVKGDYYRELYNNWKDNNTVRQGVYSVYGDNRGCWFFGTQFTGVKGRNITKVAIKITRLEGGTYAGVTHTLKAHGYSTKPSGQPSYLDWSQTFTLAVGSSTTVTITNPTILNAIRDGICKGFGLYNNGGVYSVCSGSATVVITYQ